MIFFPREKETFGEKTRDIFRELSPLELSPKNGKERGTF